MGLAFCVAGLTFGICAVLAAYFARQRQFTKHRHWAIRSYGQMIAPMLYRYFYLLLGGLGLYPETELDCNIDTDVCHPFTQVFDMIHVWTYFLFPLLCTEIIIWSLPKNAINDDDEKAPTTTTTAEEAPVVMEEEEEEGTNDSPPNKQPATAILDYTRLNVLGVVGAVACVASTVLIYVTSIRGTNSVST